MKYPLHASVRTATLVVAITTCLFAQTPGSKSPPDSDEVVELTTFTVSASKPDQYLAADSNSAGRIRTSLKDTAGSISVLTGEMLKDVAPARAFEATRYVAGISEGRGDGFADRQFIRGFESQSKTVDGFSSIQGDNADQLMMDRIEVLKGPSAIIAPNGTPGGLITVISKTPQWKANQSITATLGLIDAQRIEADVTGPINNNFAYRGLAAYQNGELAADGTRDKRKIIGGAITYRISPQTQLTLRGSFEDRWVFVYLPVFIDSSSINGGDAKLAQGFKYGDDLNGSEKWCHRGGKYGSVDALFTTAFNENISSRAAIKCQYYLQRDEYLAATPGISTSKNYNPYTGQETPDQVWAFNSATGRYEPTNTPLFDITQIPRRPYLTNGHKSDCSLQYDLAAKYKLNWFTSTSVLGVAYDKGNSYSCQFIGPSLMFDLTHPVYGATAVYTTLNTKAKSSASQWQYYCNELLGLFDERLLINAGLVRVSAKQDSLNVLTNADTKLDDSKNLVSTGGLFKVTKDISVYSSFSMNSVPGVSNNQPLWQDGRQIEFGVKYSAFNQRLSITADHFQITQTNVSVPNPAYQADPTQPQSIISDQKAHGYELEAMGGITKELSVVGSVTFIHLRDSLDRRVRGVADRNAGLLVNYKFNEGAMKGVSVFAGVTYTGSRSGEAPGFTVLGVAEQPSFFLAPVTLANVGVRYTWKKITFVLNVDNVFDKQYVGIPTSRTNAGIGLPRNIRLTTTYQF